ncbi:hypothetical protein PG989_005276 [Apiospora arundinis]
MYAHSLKRRSRLLSPVFIFFFSLFVFFQLIRWCRPASGTNDRVLVEEESGESCRHHEGLDDVFVVFKTGATEALDQVPTHLATSLRCVPNYAIYSDFDEIIDGVHVQDALDEVRDDIKTSHPDFEYYQRLQQGGRSAFSDDENAQWAATESTIAGRDTPGWRLDKWKFLPIAEKALRQGGAATSWYVFYEGDSYIFWRNILDWISNLDPAEPHYLGNPMIIGDVAFAHGGSGFVLSRAALEMVVEYRHQNLEFYDAYTGSHWAGDCVLGKALADAGVPLLYARPNLHGDHPAELGFLGSVSDPTSQDWCYNIGSYHHMAPSDIVQMSMFERKWNRGNRTLLRHGDVFKNWILPHITSRRDGWDNMSEDIVEYPEGTTVTMRDCYKVCLGQPDCMQYSLSGQTTCRTSQMMRLGRRRPAAAGEETMASGWMTHRVNAFVEVMDEYCGQDGWVLP